MNSIALDLKITVARALSDALAEYGIHVPPEDIDPLIQTSKRADYQANAPIGLGKRFEVDPYGIASSASGHMRAEELIFRVEPTSSGFLNIDVENAAIGERVLGAVNDSRIAVPASRSGTCVVDYSSPNVAKEMHVGHLRSTVIGDACARILEWMGMTVVRRNHLGDWGTPFGMLIEHLRDLGVDGRTTDLSLRDLNDLYKAARSKFDGSEAFRVRSRACVVALQAGKEDTVAIWSLLLRRSQRHFLKIYDLLDVLLDSDDFVGESHYNDELIDLTLELRGKGLIEDSEQAECVYPPGFQARSGDRLPLIIRKNDGGFGYAATDLAALRERLLDMRAKRLAYVVGATQERHFEMIFATAESAGWVAPGVSMEHVRFGSVLGKDGKMLASRSGQAARLSDLLDEAVERAESVVSDKSPHLDAETRTSVARAVGIGAVKYADLSSNRDKDYVFDLDRMLSLDGNTAPYLQYACARVSSLLVKVEHPADAPVILVHPIERELALELLRFPDHVEDAVSTLSFHRLANHLYGIATLFSRFYATCPVLTAESDSVRNSRAQLARLVGRTIRQGLSLLGIRTPERM